MNSQVNIFSVYNLKYFSTIIEKKQIYFVTSLQALSYNSLKFIGVPIVGY